MGIDIRVFMVSRTVIMDFNLTFYALAVISVK